MTGDITGKCAVVTGAGAHSERVHGIGESISRRFVAEGADVIVVDYDQAMVDRAVADISDAGPGSVRGMATDITDEGAIEALAHSIEEHEGTVDILVNNAGIRIPGSPVTELDGDAFDDIFAVNLKGMALCSKHLIPLMEDGGSIVNISSANAKFGRQGWTAYDSTKAGVLALTRDMACDHAADGIRVNSLLPGPTVTDYHIQDADDPEARIEEAIEPSEHGPGILNRSAHPDEIAAGVLFLASEESSFITGASIPVDGGLTAGRP